MAKQQKQPQQKKLNKAQTTLEIKKREVEVKRQKAMVKDVLFPYLIANSPSILKGKQLAYECQQMIEQAFQGEIAKAQREWSEKKLSELTIVDTMKKGDAWKVNQGLFDLFKEETVSLATGLLMGIQNAIDALIRKETDERKLDTLKGDILSND